MLGTIRSLPLVLALLLVAGCATTPALQVAEKPEEVGLSSQRLKELTAAFRARVEEGQIPGAVVLVARDNKIALHEAIGYRDREAQVPMTQVSLFRMASMTKPITTLSIMILQEEGRLRITDPLSRYLPEFRDLKVGIETPDGAGKTRLELVPAQREITLLDLMRHTSGITYGMFGARNAVKDLYNGANLFDQSQSPADFRRKMAGLPLMFQPGTRWDYGMSTDVLARVVEVVSGKRMDEFAHERIIGPLRMTQTRYWVDPQDHPRIAEPQVIKATGKRPAFPEVRKRPNWIPGGHGLVSTAGDYARFCQMLLNGGVLDGVRIASRESIQEMTRNHLTAAMEVPAGWNALGVIAPTPQYGQGFGLGFVVRTSEGTQKVPGSIGDYSWSGAQGTYFWVDPKERMFAILLTQAPTEINRATRASMRELVYRALRN